MSEWMLNFLTGFFVSFALILFTMTIGRSLWWAALRAIRGDLPHRTKDLERRVGKLEQRAEAQDKLNSTDVEDDDE